MAEAMRAGSLEKTPFAMISRALAGVVGRTLVINLPGNPKGVSETLEILLPVIPHTVEVLQGKGDPHESGKHHNSHTHGHDPWSTTGFWLCSLGCLIPLLAQASLRAASKTASSHWNARRFETSPRINIRVLTTRHTVAALAW